MRKNFLTYSITNFIVIRTMSSENPCSSLPSLNFKTHPGIVRKLNKMSWTIPTRYDKKPKFCR